MDLTTKFREDLSTKTLDLKFETERKWLDNDKLGFAQKITTTRVLKKERDKWGRWETDRVVQRKE